MSTATAEPPAAVQAEALASEVAKQAPITPQNPITLEIGNIVKNSQKGRGLYKPEEAKKEAEPEKKEEPEKKAEPEKAVEPEKKEEPVIKHNAEHFKVVTTARDAAIKEAAEWKEKFEAAQKTPPPEVVTKLTDYEKQLKEIAEERDTLRSKVREVDITLDPQFNKEFTAPVATAQREVFDLLIKGGATKEEATNAVTAWDDGMFSEVTAGFSDIQKRRFDAAVLETERLAKLRQAQIKQPEDYAAKRRQAEEVQQQQSVKQRQSAADRIFNSVLEATPVLKEEGNKKFVDAMQSQLSRAVKGEMPVEELLGRVAGYEAMQLGLQGQHETLVAMQAELEAVKKERDELNEFVKKNAGGTLRTEANGGADATDASKYVPITQRLVLK